MTVAILPIAQTQFFDNSGNPLAGGSVYFYIPATTTLKDTYSDSAGVIPNTNPVVLDSAGRANIWGSGSYRQLVKNSAGVTIFDQVTASLPQTSANVSYTAPGAGAVTRTLTAKLTDIVSIIDYGGDPTGANDNAAALSAAFTSLAATGGTVYFPAGTYKFSSQVSFVYPALAAFSFTLMGAGSDATALNWTGSNGLLFNLSAGGHSFHLMDMSISTDSVDTYTGVTVTQTAALGIYNASDITRCTFRGSDIAHPTNCWGHAVTTTGLCDLNITGCSFWGASIAGVLKGVGFLYQGNAAATQFAVIANLSNCQFTFLNEGVTYGDYVQGMTLSQCNFTQVAYGVHQLAGSGAVGVGAQLGIINCQMAATLFGVALQGVIGDVLISGSVLYASFANAVCFYTGPASTVVRLTITGNTIEGNNAAGSQAVVISGTSSSVAIVGNTIFGMVTGIDCAAGSNVTNGTISGNTFNGIGTANSGIILGGTNNYIVMTGNAFASLGFGISLGAGSSVCNVQSNTYAVTVLTPVANAGAGNTVGGGSI